MTLNRAVKFWCAYVIFMVILPSLNLQFTFAATDTISSGQRVTVSDTLVSSGQSFELGFFQPTNSTNYYLGIWYKKVSRRTVVWVANRDFPFTRSSTYLAFSDGNLVIVDEKARYSVTNISSNSNTNATLLDSGNLVMRDERSNLMWESFDSPTDNFLPGMRIGYDRSTGKNWSFVSWSSYDDPRPGDFSLIHDPSGKAQFFIMKRSQIYWKSGELDGHGFWYSDMSLTERYNFSTFMDQNTSFFSYSVYDDKIISRLALDVGGQAQQLTWFESAKQWVPFWSQLGDQCDVYGYCGVFTSCSTESQPFCSCLKGFEPRDSDSWEKGMYSQGCIRKSNLQCNDSGRANTSPDRFNALRNVRPPANPTGKFAQNFKECEKSCLSNCNCNAFAFTVNNCSTWEGDLVNVQLLSEEYSLAQDLYIRLAASEFYSDSDRNQRIFKMAMMVVAVMIVPTLVAVFILWCWRRNSRAEKGENLLSYDFSAKPEDGIHELIQRTTAEQDKKQKEIPIFCFSSFSAATDGFSSANKLGEGGFGLVYKGKLLNGHEVAVKRLSRRFGQGLEELRNEAMLMGKLQHKNLVKLLGCCIDGDEKILIYEYLPNKSLDFFLFDPSKHGVIDWSCPVYIIEGIAQGLLYLHQFSRVQIIHRDLKASNVLLDKDMNPKISDFGMARIFSGKNSQATRRIVGTYGYMSPEYASEDIFSVKSDVFSFGVLLLEILSGKKNTDFYNTDCLHLLGYAWDLWKKGRSSELMDPALGEITPETGIVRYINIALLCVQENASERPVMAEVVTMLSNEGANLPFPKQPAFTRGLLDPDQNQNQNGDQVFSVNELTVSILNAQ